MNLPVFILIVVLVGILILEWPKIKRWNNRRKARREVIRWFKWQMPVNEDIWRSEIRKLRSEQFDDVEKVIAGIENTISNMPIPAPHEFN